MSRKRVTYSTTRHPCHFPRFQSWTGVAGRRTIASDHSRLATLSIVVNRGSATIFRIEGDIIRSLPRRYPLLLTAQDAATTTRKRTFGVYSICHDIGDEASTSDRAITFRKVRRPIVDDTSSGADRTKDYLGSSSCVLSLSLSSIRSTARQPSKWYRSTTVKCIISIV